MIEVQCLPWFFPIEIVCLRTSTEIISPLKHFEWSADSSLRTAELPIVIVYDIPVWLRFCQSCRRLSIYLFIWCGNWSSAQNVVLPVFRRFFWSPGWPFRISLMFIQHLLPDLVNFLQDGKAVFTSWCSRKPWYSAYVTLSSAWFIALPWTSPKEGKPCPRTASRPRYAFWWAPISLNGLFSKVLSGTCFCIALRKGFHRQKTLFIWKYATPAPYNELSIE